MKMINTLEAPQAIAVRNKSRLTRKPVANNEQALYYLSAFFCAAPFLYGLSALILKTFFCA